MRKTKLTDKMTVVLNGRDSDFNEQQLKIIKNGLESGFATEQVLLYARPEFDEYRMAEILEGLKNHIPDNLVALYANPIYDAQQMHVIRMGFENKVTEEQASIYMNPGYTAQQMHIIMNGFIMDLPIEEINIFADKKFDADQMYEIMYALRIKAAPLAQIKHYADPKYCAPELSLIYSSLQSGLTPEQICLFVKPGVYSNNQMLTFCELLKRGFCENDIIHSINEIESILKKANYATGQIRAIYNGLSFGLTIEQIKFGADPVFSSELMNFIFSNLAKGFSEEQIQFCLNNGKTTKIQNEILRDFTNGLTEKQIKYYLSHKCTRHQKDVYRTLIAENAPYPDRYIDNITHFKRKTSTECADILSIYSAKNVDLKKLDVLAQKPLSPEQMQFILNSLIKNDVTKNIHQRNENDRKDISQMEK
ncbi:hypothetical protein DW920_14690 [Clostridium sp. AM42-36]|mgnify:CR=1 FL=1|jgi:hypothetical protein|nr:hypothetical protein DW920_14690 [Clostridium sp. AM42-36]